MQPKPSVMDLPVYVPGKSASEVKKELGLAHIVKLASNENPFGTSPRVKEALLAEMENTSLYPDGASQALKTALAEHLQVDPEQLLFGAGSDEVLLMAARAFLLPGDEVVMADRTFPQYKHNSDIEGAICIEVPLKDGVHDLEAMLEQVTARTKIVWICNPNNPTGTIVSDQALRTFLNALPSTVLVALDEAYCEYCVSEDFSNGIALLKEYPNLLLLRTFSKIYGLASLRIGYGIGNTPLIHVMNQVREPFNTTRFAQTAAIAAIEDQAFVEKCRAINRQELNRLCTQFTAWQLSYYPAHGNFVMVDVKRDAKQVFEALLRKGYIVRGGHALGFPTSLRITVGTPEQNDGLITALREVLDAIPERG